MFKAKTIINAQLLQAAAKGDINSFDAKLKLGATTDAVDKDGRNSALLAAYNGQTAMYEHLINNHGFNVDFISVKGETAELLAQQGGHPKMTRFIKQIVQKPTSVTYANQKVSSVTKERQIDNTELNEALLTIAEAGNIAEFDKLIVRGADRAAKDNYGSDAALTAAASGQIAMYDHLIRNHGFNKAAKAENGIDATLFAAYHGQKAMYDHLIRNHGFNKAVKIYNGRDAALIAAGTGQIAMYDHLIRNHRLDKTAKDENGYDAALLAAGTGQIAMYDHLIRNHRLDKTAKDNGGYDAALTAAANGQIEMYDNLIRNHGFNKTAKDNYGLDAAFVAAYQGQKAMYDHLIRNHGFNKNKAAKTNKGHDAALMTAFFGHQEMYDHLVRNHGFNKAVKTNNGSDAALSAAENGQTEMYDHLIRNHGFNKAVKTNNGYDVTLIAAYSGQKEMYDHLIRNHGFNKAVKINNGFDAALIAAANGQTEMYDHLIRNHGFNKAAKTNNGYDVTLLAAYHGQKAMYEHLINNHGFDINSRNNDGETAKDIAVANEHTEIVKYIENLEAQSRYSTYNPHQKASLDDDVTSKLYEAVQSGDIEALNDLIKQGANINIIDKNGRDLALHAAHSGQKNIYGSLVNYHGFKKDYTDIQGNNAAHIAALAGHREIYEYLAKTAKSIISIPNTEGHTAQYLATEYPAKISLQQKEQEIAEINRRRYKGYDADIAKIRADMEAMQRRLESFGTKLSTQQEMTSNLAELLKQKLDISGLPDWLQQFEITEKQRKALLDLQSTDLSILLDSKMQTQIYDLKDRISDLSLTFVQEREFNRNFQSNFVISPEVAQERQTILSDSNFKSVYYAIQAKLHQHFEVSKLLKSEKFHAKKGDVATVISILALGAGELPGGSAVGKTAAVGANFIAQRARNARYDNFSQLIPSNSTTEADTIFEDIARKITLSLQQKIREVGNNPSRGGIFSRLETAIIDNPEKDIASYAKHLANLAKENILNGNLHVNWSNKTKNENCDTNTKKRNIIRHTTNQIAIKGVSISEGVIEQPKSSSYGVDEHDSRRGEFTSVMTKADVENTVQEILDKKEAEKAQKQNEEALQRRLGAASSNPLQGALARAAASKRNEQSYAHHF